MRSQILLILLILSCCILSNCGIENQAQPTWHLVYKNSQKGETLYGSKQDLIDALRMGSPLRVGFGGSRVQDTTRSIEHIADAELITITNSEDVFAQVSTFIGQTPALEADTVTIKQKAQNKFNWIIGTNGTMSGLSIDYIIDSLHTPRITHRGFYWYVNTPISKQAYDELSNEYPEALWKNPRRR